MILTYVFLFTDDSSSRNMGPESFAPCFFSTHSNASWMDLKKYQVVTKLNIFRGKHEVYQGGHRQSSLYHDNQGC